MTKRTKLLSIMVAAVLCFVAGFAIMFGSNKTASAEVVVPNLPQESVYSGYDLTPNTFMGNPTIVVENGCQVTGGWVIYDWYVPAGQSTTTAAPGLNLMIAQGWTSSFAASETSVYTRVTDSDIVSNFTTNATDKDVRVRVAFDVDNGEVYYSVGKAEFAKLATFENYEVIQALEKVYVYLRVDAGRTINEIHAFKMYNEDFAEIPFRAGNSGNINIQNNSETFAIKDYSGNHDAKQSTLTFGGTGQNFINKTGASPEANYIIFEWKNPATNSGVTGGANTVFHYMGTGAFSAYTGSPCYGNGNDTEYINNASGAEETVKLFYNLNDGTIFALVDGGYDKINLWNGSSVSGTALYNVGEGYDRTQDMFAGFGIWSGGAKADFIDLKCYDDLGNDLGISTTMKQHVNIEATSFGSNAIGGGRWFLHFKYTTASGEEIDSTGSGATVATGSKIYINGEETTVHTGFGMHQDSFLIGATSFGDYAWGKQPNAVITIPTSSITGANYVFDNESITFTVYGESGMLGAAPETQLNLGANQADELVLFNSNGTWRYQGSVALFNANTGEELALGGFGIIPAYKNGGDELSYLSYYFGDNTHLINIDNLVGVNDVEVLHANPCYYVVKAGTLIGAQGYLAEDIIITVGEDVMHIFEADKEFAINYEGMDGKENPNPTTRKFDEAVTITAIDDPLFDGWDKTEIPAYTAGDVTVTASWVEAQWLDYNLTISEDLSLSFNVRNVGSVSLTAIFTMDIDEDTAITETVSMYHYHNEVMHKIIYVNFTFDNILPQHLGDNINVKIMYGDIQMLEMDVTVKDYLDEKIAGDASEEEKALAQDLLYYGAAAQLYTGHDVDNLPADLDGVSVDLPEDLSVYAKEGEKDAEYYWKKAEVVYDNTVSLVLTFAAPADLDKLVVNVLNAEVEKDFVAKQVSAGIYEVTIALPATQFGNTLKLTIEDNGVAMGQILTYSVYSYIAEVETADTAYITLLERLYCYGAAANKFANLDA